MSKQEKYSHISGVKIAFLNLSLSDLHLSESSVTNGNWEIEPPKTCYKHQISKDWIIHFEESTKRDPEGYVIYESDNADLRVKLMVQQNSIGNKIYSCEIQKQPENTPYTISYDMLRADHPLFMLLKNN